MPSVHFEELHKYIQEGQDENCASYWMKLSKMKRLNIINEFHSKLSSPTLLDTCINRGEDGLPVLNALLCGFNSKEMLSILNPHVFSFPRDYRNVNFLYTARNRGLFKILPIVFQNIDSGPMVEFLTKECPLTNKSVFFHFETTQQIVPDISFELMAFLTDKCLPEDRYKLLNQSMYGIFHNLMKAVSEPEKYCPAIEALFDEISWYHRAKLLSKTKEDTSELPIPFAQSLGDEMPLRFEECILQLLAGMSQDLQAILSTSYTGIDNLRTIIKKQYGPIYHLEQQKIAEAQLVVQFSQIDLNTSAKVAPSPIKFLSNGPNGIVLGYLCKALTPTEISSLITSPDQSVLEEGPKLILTAFQRLNVSEQGQATSEPKFKVNLKG